MSSPSAYTVKSLAAEWSCSPRTIYDLISAGKLAVFRLGDGKRGIRIPATEVQRWLAEKTKTCSELEGSGSDGTGPSTDVRLLPSSAIRALVSKSA